MNGTEREPADDDHADADPAERARYVYHRRPRCPCCQSASLKTQRTSRHGDESVTRHCVCRECGARVFLVVE